MADTSTTSSVPSSSSSSTAASAASAPAGGLGDVVRSHYNTLEESGKEARKESRIYHMRNLNNWIKSQLVNEYVDKLRDDDRNRDRPRRLNVLDIGCGKGGDLLKWQKVRATHVVCCDIADTSIEQCRGRYQEMRQRNGNLFTAEFHAADCTKVDLTQLFSDPNMEFDIVSCQFAFHYCFESLQQANTMLKNISSHLRPRGYFIGTTPDAFDVVKRLRESPDQTKAGNSVYSVALDSDDMVKLVKNSPESIPLFGARYMFHLEGVVDCPEFLVHFPTLVTLAEKHKLMQIAKRRFDTYFKQFQDRGKDLLTRMNALETYPPHGDVKLVGRENEDFNYAQAREALGNLGDGQRIGTLSLEEWEACTLYCIFAFRKMSGE